MRVTIKKIATLLVLLNLSLLTACNSNDPEAIQEEFGELNLVTLSTNPENQTITNINMATGMSTSFTIECLVFSSAVYDRAGNSLGYVDCNNTFQLVNPLTGALFNSFDLPGPLSQVVIDEDDHMLIGLYYEENVGNHLVMVNINSGEIMANNVIDGLQNHYACSQFYNQEEQAYYIITENQKLLKLNPSTGTILNTVDLDFGSNIIHYQESSNTLIGLTYSQEEEANYIELLDTSSGSRIQKTKVATNNNYAPCATDYDAKGRNFVTVTANREVIFINVDSGEITNSYPFDEDVNAFIFWREQ